MTAYDALTSGRWAWLVLPATVALLLVLALLLHRVSVLVAERTHASRVARLLDTLGSVADGIAHTLLAHPPAAANVLAAVRQAAIAQGVAYVRATLGGTVAAIGVSDDVLAARLGNAVAGAELAAGAAGPGPQMLALLRAAVIDAPDTVPAAPVSAPVPATA